MPNINKVVYGNQTLIDLTNSTLSSAGQLAQGVTAYDRGGNLLTGTASGGTAAISVVDTTDSHGGTVRTITALDISDTTAVAGDVAQGKYFYTAQGVKTQGTSSGGGSVTITDEANATGTTCVITTGSAPSEDIPLNTQLIDFTAVTSGFIVDGTTGQEVVSQWSSCSDYTLIDPTMTFDYIGYQWYDLVFYNASKAYISCITMYQDSGVTIVNDYAHGTLTPSKIPSTAKYVRIDSYPTNPTSTQLSLIRTA